MRFPNEQHPQTPITLPAAYSFNDTFSTADLRITRTFVLGRALQLLLIGEVFNLFNTANLVQYGGNVADPATFGQPGARFNQVFGSSGLRAFQFATRLRF